MQKQKSFRPELLLPVGNTECFYAAIQGGADAIYVGLKDFNARGRATNFTPYQLAAIINIAHKKNIKVYITLNTVIRNIDIKQLSESLFILNQLMADAVIIQDWGVYYLIKKFFPNLKIHASTQMAIHNSIGVNSAASMGIERVVLARELTQTELQEISIKSNAEIEIFIHGALCYSFSGMCLFSSYLGGASANRGQCAQPCRRNYTQNENESYFFSLKDNQLIDHLPLLEKMKIDSLKIEGRVKSAEYVYQVASAYRMALDFPEKREEAKTQLQFDLGREKTDYFYGKNLGEAITQAATAGLFAGIVSANQSNTVYFTCSLSLNNPSKLRFRDRLNDRQFEMKVATLKPTNDGYKFNTDNKEIKAGDEVYVASTLIKFQDRINTDGIKISTRLAPDKLQNIISRISVKPTKPKHEIFLRIDTLDWLEKINFDDFDAIILNLNRKEFLYYCNNYLKAKENKYKIHLELPKFIAEADIDFYKSNIQQLYNSGHKNFFISHLSQKNILPLGTQYSTNENVYIFNDAAIRLLKEEGVSNYIYPQENDIVNLAKGTDRTGIIPVYFYPWLFYSRMPVKLEKNIIFEDKNGARFRKYVRDGFTITIPEHPVSLTLFKNKLERYGFNRFLIDLSSLAPSANIAGFIKKQLLKSESIKPSTIFNFKRELK